MGKWRCEEYRCVSERRHGDWNELLENESSKITSRICLRLGACMHHDKDEITVDKAGGLGVELV